MELILENAQSENIDFIWSLYSESVKPLMAEKINGGWIDEVEKEKFLKQYSETDTHIIKIEGEVVGWIDYQQENGQVLLKNGYILPSKRRNGIGSALISQLLVDADGAVAEVIVGNPYNSFFEKLGFKEVDRNEHLATFKI